MFVAAPHSVASAPTASVVLGATDPGSSRLVYAMVIGLVLVGIALVLLGIWIVRQTRPDLEVLAPLERMGDRDWKKRDPATQRRMLDELRPDGAAPLAEQAPPPPLDVEFEQSEHPVPSLGDLGPGVLTDDDPSAGSDDHGDAVDEPDVADTGSDDEFGGPDEPAAADGGLDDDVDDDLVGDDASTDVEVEDAVDEPEVTDTGADDDVDAADEPDAADEGPDGEVDDPDRVGDERSDEVAMAEVPPVGDDDERADDVAADQR